MPPLRLFLTTAFAASSLLLSAKSVPIPDFTKGDPIPEGFTKDWNLGSTGARGWIYSDQLVTSDARQILITKTDAGSPADGTLAPGDVILGVAGKAFSYDPRTEFGKAITSAEESGKLALIRWRDGKEQQITLTLPVLGKYSATAPYDCEKSRRIFEQGIKALALRMADENYPRTQNPITRSLNALALLASGEATHIPLVKREAKWAAEFSSDSFATWYNAYVIMLVSEYTLATGDKSLLPGLRRLAMQSATGQSAVGSWGHNFALPNGTLTGYGMMNAPGVPLTISLIMARAAGVTDKELPTAIEKSARLMRYYIGKGAVPYGDHAPWTQTHEDNGKSGMASKLFQLLDEPEGSEFFARMSLASHGAERDCGHTGNFLNILWAAPAVSLNGPQATGAWMNEFGAWYFDLARRWDFSFPHQGPPEPKNDSYGNWDATGSYLLAYALPLKSLYLTGKKASTIPQLDRETALAIINDGRGWSNKVRNSAYDSLTPDDLVERLSSWSPSVRERAAAALSRRKEGMPVPALTDMLDSSETETRLGACEALGLARAAAAPAIPDLLKQLDHPDLWVRVKAAEALGSIGQPAIEALPVLLERLVKGATEKDPRGMEQRHLCDVVFTAMLRNSLDGVDRDLLRKAVAAVLRNEDGRARSTTAAVYKKLSFEEIEPLLPAILDAVVTPAPSGEMFADGVRIAGLEVLASHHIAEGIPACADYLREQNKWASEKRTPQILKILLSYGAHAKSAIPHLEETAALFEKGEKNFPGHLSKQKAAHLREAIATINTATDAPKLRKLGE
jgi:HEAT repeat protein